MCSLVSDAVIVESQMINECGAVGSSDQNTWRKFPTLTLLPLRIPHDLTWDGA